MNQEEREQAEAVLATIPKAAWEQFFQTAAGKHLSDTIQVATVALRAAGVPGANGSAPGAAILDLLGDRLLCERPTGEALRALIIRAASSDQWAKLREAYWAIASDKALSLHGKASQQGRGADVVASYWHQGGRWARTFCRICELPEILAARRADALPEDESVEAVAAQPPLHPFQQEVYEGLGALLRGPAGHNALLSLPTGAGKTRVAVEAIIDRLATLPAGGRRNVVLWFAHSDELLRQAWECFKEVWQSPPMRWDEARIPRRSMLHLRRAWGGKLNPEQLDLEAEPTVVFGGVQQLRSWVAEGVPLAELWPLGRLACVVVDEAHRVLTSEYGQVLGALGLKKQHHWEPYHNSPPVIGLTATPWRAADPESQRLQKYFQGRLLTPAALGRRPITTLQTEKILSRVRQEDLHGGAAPPLTTAQQQRLEQFHDLPPDYLGVLGREPARNASILKRLLKLPAKSSALVFACSVEHAEILTLALNRAGRSAACVHAQTPRDERLNMIQQFRARELGFLCNYGVLTTGFDAPLVDVVCIARPTMSALLYEQMVGRGLRGPANGGTSECLVLDVQDAGLPAEVMSYARVVHLWAS